MENIKNLFRENRPKLSESTLTTYYSILSSLHNKLFNSKTININNFNQIDLIIDFLESKPINTRRTVLSALYVLTNEPVYREEMLKNILQIKMETEKQIPNKKQKENSITQIELKNIYEKLKKRADILYKTKSATYLMDIQDFIIVALYYLIPPRRVMDYTEFKIKNINKTIDNYMNKDAFVFNQYKTSKTYGRQVVAIPATLKKIIKQWIKINPTDYLLFDRKQNKLTAQTLSIRLNKIFGEGVSVNALRHSYLSTKYFDTIKKNKDISNDMSQMGSSIGQQKTYIQTME